MAAEPRTLRCAIYTRKSTEHGLEQEFNSLHAQREACEAYIKSQGSLGWRVASTHYDDPAFSGGNLERPALKRLLADIDAGKIDTIVVYKIDRLTRSLSDFAKLVETFDARSISFVAVTQQFNTTTSMGRLTLNILLSFAQFERELSSERVRDKIAASRRKGKWTGGTVALGYEALDKKLVIHEAEAKTVRTIFRLYLELQSFSKLVAELDRQGIVTKRRTTKVAKYKGGIPFTYGPLSYFLRNRIYLGEVHHKGKWFKAEHKAIVDRKTFDHVQELLAANVNTDKTKWQASGAPLLGKLFDNRGNAMRPSFSTKNGVRYRFYVNTAILRARKDPTVSIKRVSAPNIEKAIETALQQRTGHEDLNDSPSALVNRLQRATLKADCIELTADISTNPRNPEIRTFDVAWLQNARPDTTGLEMANGAQPDPKLLQAMVRAHAWLRQLTDGKHASIESLAAAENIHPKVVRQAVRLAFLSPEITDQILRGHLAVDLSLKAIPHMLDLSWKCQNPKLSVE